MEGTPHLQFIVGHLEAMKSCRNRRALAGSHVNTFLAWLEGAGEAVAVKLLR